MDEVQDETQTAVLLWRSAGGRVIVYRNANRAGFGVAKDEVWVEDCPNLTAAISSACALDRSP